MWHGAHGDHYRKPAPLKEIVPVRHFPFWRKDLSELMAMVYEAVPSAVTVPPWRPDPNPPITRDLRFRIFLRHQPNLLIFVSNHRRWRFCETDQQPGLALRNS